MTDDDRIPPPSQEDMRVSLDDRFDALAEVSQLFGPEMAIIRRCHAAEAELARLRLAVDAAVRAERERAARIADERARYYCECREQMRSTELARNFFGGGQEASEKIAAAIRGATS